MENSIVLDDQLSVQCSNLARRRLRRIGMRRGGTKESALVREALNAFLDAEEKRLGITEPLPRETDEIQKILSGAMYESSN